ncbi:heavy metal translocating P-type ATPase, partial [Mycobacterium sp.]|uniref:heavy metal translocating P-type ATPase n=1 Tax=Mycobacterium sp. TaxID=1785 RepID=UPI002D4EEEC4
MASVTAEIADTRTGVAPRRTALWALPEVRWAVAATALFVAGLVAQLAGGPGWLWWGLYLACYVTGGWEPAWAGLRALRHKTLDVDLLMIAAGIGAAAIGQILDGALLIVIFSTSGALEALATRRTEDSVRGLLDLAPDQATRLMAGGHEQRVDTAVLAVGDEILIRPGERVGADGEILDGASDVDQSTITGESFPVSKTTGEQVFAGTLNGSGALRVRVDREASQTVLARIVAMVTEASATKATTQLFIEKVEQRYSVGMVAATLALFFGPLLFGAALQPTLLRAMTFMIVASPCAVVLATMPPLLSAIANAGRHGVLVKSAVVMERLADTTMVAFDKTGTLTEGTPQVAEIRVLPGAGLDEATVLSLAASAERPSEHPLGAALVGAARDRGLRLLPADEFTAMPGRGVSAVVAGRRVQVSNPRRGPTPDPVSPQHITLAQQAGALAAELQASGQTAVVVTIDDGPVAVLGFEDRVRANAPQTVAALTNLTETTPVLMTGDNPSAASHLAGKVGIPEVHAGLLPQDKVSRIHNFERGGAKVALVGDGVNDAPALAAAHTGIAMGRVGSDLALDTADVVVVRDELAAIPAAITLSRRARRVVAA